MKVFEKAKNFREYNKTSDVLPVVLLDEIGLAEISKYNPLKVLHSLLEPSDNSFPDVAVVGISNWALDAAKMNRAIHLSRPEPDVEDLFETGISLREANMHTRTGGTYPDDKQLRYLAEVYHKYQGSQRYPNFHGLRDYYSLIKCLSTEPKDDTLQSTENTKKILHALQRNFGGVPKDVKNFQNLFQEGLQMEYFVGETCHFLTTELIYDNLHDKLARHLMIITNGDSAIGILDQTLQSLQKEKITIFGSKFEEDLSEEYNYRVLSRIILCMERDCVLILRDLESIYGSLYDMLNQNYTVVGGKKNCRVALGAFSNPMCQVHDGFRCIVLIEQKQIDFTDPPFLNRFEKQQLRFSDVLNEEQRQIISALDNWVKDITTILNFESQFRYEDMFVGFCDDTLPSLVLKNSQDQSVDQDEILEQCKQDLMMVASPDGVLRSMESHLTATNLEEVQTLHDSYFQKPLHSGLKNYLKHALETVESDSESEHATYGMRLVVMTHSNINLDVSQCVDGLVKCQTEKLSAFKSEKQLTRKLESFWKSKNSLLVLQCKPELDAAHMLLAKSIIEQQRDEYLKERMETTQKQIKHVCVVIHVQRESKANEAGIQRWQFSFQSGWKQVTIDVLEEPALSITDCLDASITDLLESKSFSFEDEASNQFLWCFTRIKYPITHQPSLDAILHLEQSLRSSPELLRCFKDIVMRWLRKRGIQNSQWKDPFRWQLAVACDRQALINSSHLMGAIQHYVSHLIRQPLAKIVYFLESESAWPRFLFTGDTLDEKELDVWLKLMFDEEIFNTDEIPDHQGAESYSVSQRCMDLKFPFASVFSKKVEQVQHMFVEEQRRLLLDETNLNDNEELREAVVESQLHRFASVVKQKVPQVYDLAYLQRNIELYVEDLLDMVTVQFSDVFTRSERVDFLKSAMAHDVKFLLCGDPALVMIRLHSLLWLKGSSYMTALQVFETCHDVSDVHIKDLLCKYIPTFERSLFHDKPSATLEAYEDEESVGKIRQYKNLNPKGKCISEVTHVTSSKEANNGTQSQGGPDSEETKSDLRWGIDRATEVHSNESVEGKINVAEAADIKEENENKVEDQTQTVESADLSAERHLECFSEGQRSSQVISCHEADVSTLNQITSGSDDGLRNNTKPDDVQVQVQCMGEHIVQHDHLQEEVETAETGSEDLLNECISRDDELEEAEDIEELSVDDDEQTTVSFEEELVELISSSLLQTQTVESADLSAERHLECFSEGQRSGQVISCHEADVSTLNQITSGSDDGLRNNTKPDDVQVQVQCMGEHIVQHDHLQEEVETAETGSEDLLNECISRDDELEEAEDIEELSVDDDEQTTVSFEEELVELISSSLLPTDDAIKSFEGVDCWQRKTSLFLSKVIRMPVQIPVFYYLRVCYDFLSLLLLPENLELDPLYMLGELGKSGAFEGYLDSPDAFDRITRITDELEERGVQEGRVADFLMVFYGRCIDSNPDSPVLSSILSRICSNREKSLMQFVGPLVHRIFLMEEQLCPGVFEKLLLHSNTINEYPGIQEISQALQSLPRDDELNCPFAVLCCDLIGEVASWDVDFSSVSTSEGQILVNFRKAFQTMVGPCDETEHEVFNLLCAAAYLRSILTSFVKFILLRRQCLVEDGEFSMVMNEINALFAGQTKSGPCATSELQIYFLKELKKELYMFDVHKICQRSSRLPALKSLELKDEILIGKMSFDPFQKYTKDSAAQAALATLLDKNNSKPFEEIISNLPMSSEQRVEVAALLTKSFFLIRSERNLRDSEDKAAEVLTKKLDDVQVPYAELLRRILGKKDFKTQEMCISPESSSADVHRAILILHLSIILASEFSTAKKDSLAFMSHFANPLASQNALVLASGESREKPYTVHHNCSAEEFKQTSTFFCDCGMLFVFASKGDKTSCPNCRSECQGQNKGNKNECPVEPPRPSKGYVLIPRTQDIFHKVRDLKPTEFRILHFFVCSVLYGGCSLELFDEKCLSQILRTEHSEKSPSRLCFQQIDNDVKALCSLLDAKEKDVIRFLHCAIEKCKFLLTTAVHHPTEISRLEWEKKFSAALSPLICEFGAKKQLASPQDCADKSSLATQRKIEETDFPEFSGSGERSRHFPRLFRVTYPKTFTSLRAYYMSATKETRHGHALLGLFLDFNDSLPLVANLNDLLSWSRKVESLLSRRLTRKDVTKKIGDVIQQEAHSPEEKKRLNESFDRFSKAWEKVRPLVGEYLNMEVPYLSESSPISLCLIDKGGQGMFLCASLEILQDIQNDFLTKMLSIAGAGKSCALLFLERGPKKCAVPMVHLQEAREKEIIQYVWSDDILRHSQRNTEYGHGKQIFYDLEKIEKEMAARFLVGKSFLSTSDGLHQFIFSQELFHTCRGILDELQKIIPQEPLTEMFRSGLRQSEHSLETVQCLLEHMEIVLCLLKRHQVGKPDEPLTEFTDKWVYGSRPFPKSLLPQPHSAIQLKHVVALYEFFEDRLAESAAKHVNDTYRVGIPVEIAEEMKKAAPASGQVDLDRSVLTALTTALRRFIFRYLSSSEIRPESGDSLMERMQETSLWPVDANKLCKSLKMESLSKFVSSTISKKLTIRHTYHVLCFYQDRLKVSTNIAIVTFV